MNRPVPLAELVRIKCVFMPKIMDMISTRLGDRGLVSLEINRLIKDVSNVIGKERHFESTSLKKALKSLGWEEHILDYHTLELICLFLEDEREFKTNQQTGP